ncbi:MAG: B12-binding domain-containing radical SAM protein [Deltaproteobacteria bacterium]|nr:MAG: B12-binding domain-containing radical SAM protein [Deltaproteobacteria bacterium]
MKILLIYPYWLEERINTEDVVVPPIGMYSVGAVLKENHYDVEILNWCRINETPEKISEILIEKQPDVIGFSILQANRWGGIEIAKIAKRINPEVKIVFGGVSPTFLWKHFLTHFPEIDYVVMSEGEYTFLHLIRCMENKEYDHIGNIRGIAFKKHGKIIRTKPAEYIQNLDQLPIPATYFEYQHLSLTRGCPGNCTFCGSPKFWGRKVRFHSADYFVEELELLYKKGINFFYFSDDTFSVNKKRVIEICKKILKKNLKISWNAISRVNYMSEEVLSWMRKAGCIQISYGIESGSEKIRAYLNKKITTDEIERTFYMTLKYGILPRAYFIYGSPGETRKTIQESIDLIKKIKPLVIYSSVLSLFPGTALYAQYKKKSNLSEDIWLNRIEDIKYFETDAKLSRDAVISFGKKLRTTYYELLPAIVDDIELIDKKEFYPMHADFCSRLGMTFDHGDYALNEDIKEKDNIAEKLYIKALNYQPDLRAYLGLGILNQKKRAYHESVKILSKGVDYFPDNDQINLCLGISHMNLGAFETALSFFLKCQDSKQALGFIINCYHALNNSEKASKYQKKLESVA